MFLSGPVKALTHLNPIEYLWRDLKIAVHRRSPSNLVKSLPILHVKIALVLSSHCAKLVETFQKTLTVDIAAKGAFIMYWPQGLNTFTTSEFRFVHGFWR